MNSRMKFLCEDSCVNTKDGESWRGSKDYDLTEKEVKHLKDIGHLKRFRPMSNSAIDFMNKLKAKDSKQPEEKALDEMTVAELKEKAKEYPISIPKDSKRAETIQYISEAEEKLSGDKE